MYINNNHDPQKKKKRRIKKGHPQISGKADLPPYHRADSEKHKDKLGFCKFLSQKTKR